MLNNLISSTGDVPKAMSRTGNRFDANDEKGAFANALKGEDSKSESVEPESIDSGSYEESNSEIEISPHLKQEANAQSSLHSLLSDGDGTVKQPKFIDALGLNSKQVEVAVVETDEEMSAFAKDALVDDAALEVDAAEVLRHSTQAPDRGVSNTSAQTAVQTMPLAAALTQNPLKLNGEAQPIKLNVSPGKITSDTQLGAFEADHAALRAVNPKSAEDGLNVAKDIEFLTEKIQIKTPSEGAISPAAMKDEVANTVLSPSSNSILDAVRNNSNWAATDSSSRSIAQVQTSAIQKPNGEILQFLRIQLNPAELGKVELKMRMNAGQLHVEIQTETEQAYKDLTADQDAMVSRLAALGYKTDNITILGPQSDNSNAVNGQNQNDSQKLAQRDEDQRHASNGGADADGEGLVYEEAILSEIDQQQAADII